MFTRKLALFGLAVALYLPTAAAEAEAQPWRGGQGTYSNVQRDRREVGRSVRQLNDDLWDLEQFRQTLAQFDGAAARGDAYGMTGALQRFLVQGRTEVAEQRRETWQAAHEAERSFRDASYGGPRGGRRQAWDDARDFRHERLELAQEEAALAELERANAAAATYGLAPHLVQSIRQAMGRFIQLAEVEVRRSRHELREDIHQLREDRWSARQSSPWRRY